MLNERELAKLVDQLSQSFFEKPFIDEAVFNKRLRTTGGRYLPGKRRIEINPKYALEMDETELIGIIKHELCHYHLHIEGKGYRHRDQEFKELLKKTGAPRHCNPLPSMTTTFRYVYTCLQCEHEYLRQKRINLSRYRCGKCHGKLQLSEEQ